MDWSSILIIIAGVAGGMLCGFLLIVFAIYFVAKYFLTRALKQISDLTQEALKGIVPFMQPLRIKLEHELNPAWSDAAAVKRVVKPLKEAGFADAGVFVIEEVPDVTMRALVQIEKCMYAVVYEHPDKGVWFEIVSRYEDGGAFSTSTAEETGLDRPPTSVVKRFKPATEPAKVLEAHLTQRPDKALAPASVEGFRQDFERAYADEMDWRFERGGFTESEIRKNLKLADTKVTDDQVKQVHAMQQVQVNQWLATKLQENFRAKTSMSEAKWRTIEERLIFVHDRLTSEEVHGMFTSCLDWDDEDAAQEMSDRAEKLARHGPARDAFAQLIQTLAAKRVPKKLGHVAMPVAADVYLLAVAEFDEDE